MFRIVYDKDLRPIYGDTIGGVTDLDTYYVFGTLSCYCTRAKCSSEGGFNLRARFP